MCLFQILRIEHNEIRGFFSVDENSALAIDDGEFGLIAQGNRANDGTVRGVDNGGVFAAAIEAEDVLGGGVVDDGIGVRVGLDRADRLERLHVKDRYGICAAVADESAAEGGSDRDALHGWRVGGGGFDGGGVG